MILDFCVAYRLLEDYGSLRPGDAVIFNDGSSTIGQTLIQLCRILKLRAIPVISAAYALDSVTTTTLKDLGAFNILVDKGSLLQTLEAQGKMYARPMLALDCIGGQSTHRLAETLQVKGKFTTGHSPFSFGVFELSFHFVEH